GGMWLLFLQQGAYTMTTQRNDAVTKLTSTYQLMFKEIHETSRQAIGDFTPESTEPLPHDRVATGAALPYLFQYDSTNAEILCKGNPVLNDVLATFTWDDLLKVVKVELQNRTTGDRLNFLVAPRNP
ncbi:MAG TPA: hypothetical protein PKO06_22040, partial [Candidatus Ozemobacteraceae bacterium]|nr:hypothetical protein [Candidatus Ozemobacteraceae bacterium]